MTAKPVPLSEDMFSTATLKEIRFTLALNERALARGYADSGYFKGRDGEMRERVRIAKAELARRGLRK